MRVIENKAKNKGRRVVLYRETGDNENNDWNTIMGVDTGCKSTIMGELWLANVLGSMKRKELNETIQTENKSVGVFWFGIQKVTSKRTFELPIEIGNLKVSLKTEIVDGDIPWLVGTESLKKNGSNHRPRKGSYNK